MELPTDCGKNLHKHSLIFAKFIYCLEPPGGGFSFVLSLAFGFHVQVSIQTHHKGDRVILIFLKLPESVFFSTTALGFFSRKPIHTFNTSAEARLGLDQFCTFCSL